MLPSSDVRQFAFDVASNERVGDGIFRMVMHAPGLAPILSPGQFVNVAVPGDPSHITRIPLSFAGADPKAQTIEIVYAVVGEGTARLSRMGEGDASTVLGPCGKGWRLDGVSGPALLVAGGVGAPPVLAAARGLLARGIPFDVVLGAQTAGKLWGVGLAKSLGAGRVVVTTDDGTAGIKGFTTVAVEQMQGERDYTDVLTCGPQPMMAGVARLALADGSSCQVSMERMMTCGFGACNTCNVAMATGGYKACCTDGPVFDAREVAW